MTTAFIPWTESGEKAVIAGSSERLGFWNPADAPEMKPSGPFFFTSDMTMEDDEQWKLVITRGDTVIWEEGENRTGSPGITVWFRGGRRATGIEVPAFSLRSSCDCGIGDFGSLETFIAKAAAEGHKTVQLLPVDDTAGSRNPYDTYSAFAINPIYLDIQQMGTLEDAETAHTIADFSNSLAYSQTVEWEAAAEIKRTYFKAIYQQDGKSVCESKEFKKFVKAEREWLLPYAAHCCLKETGNIPEYSEEAVARMMDDEPFRDGMLYRMFLQYHADRQLRHVHDTARKYGILLGGEITSGATAGGAEAWTNPRLFDNAYRAGSVPDAEIHGGQKWNLLPPDWRSKSITGWWKRRMQKSERYYDICRLKDTAGYFRQWNIPEEFGTSVRGHCCPCSSYTQKDFKKAGLDFVQERDTAPLITREYLAEVFGPDFKRYGEFFKRNLDGTYYFKADMSTAAAIRAYFDARNGGEEELRDGLIRIMDECLFVRTPEGYQPRIAAQFTNRYRAMDDGQKHVFNRLYDEFYYTRNNGLWLRTGEKKLKTIAGSSNMVLMSDCPEPAFAKGTFAKIGVIPLSASRRDEPAVYMGAVITSTHDMPPIRQWLGHGQKRDDLLRQASEKGAALTLFPFQDWHSADRQETDYNGKPLSERINDPEAEDGNWIWRVPGNLS